MPPRQKPGKKAAGGYLNYSATLPQSDPVSGQTSAPAPGLGVPSSGPYRLQHNASPCHAAGW